MKLSNTETAIVLTALRHLQGAIDTGENLSYLEQILECEDVDSLSSFEFDDLCEKINTPEPRNLIENLPKEFSIEALSEGKNPKGIRIEVQEIGDKGICQEVGISMLTGKDCLVYLVAGLNSKTGEARFLMTADATREDVHALAVYPERDIEDAVVYEWKRDLIKKISSFH